ncbi:Hsp20/alpha crystallin family protein [Azospirillum sp. sgz301742]
MAETTIPVQTKQEGKTTRAAAREMAETGRHPLLALRDEFERLFDDASSMFRAPWTRPSLFDVEPLLHTRSATLAIVPPAEVNETETEYRVTLEVPGMDEKGVEVSLEDDMLTIKAEKKEETEEESRNRYFSERRYGMCSRSFRLPGNVDRERISASMKNGVLTIAMPKSEPSKPSKRTIDVAKA